MLLETPPWYGLHPVVEPSTPITTRTAVVAERVLPVLQPQSLVIHAVFQGHAPRLRISLVVAQVNYRQCRAPVFLGISPLALVELLLVLKVSGVLLPSTLGPITSMSRELPVARSICIGWIKQPVVQVMKQAGTV